MAFGRTLKSILDEKNIKQNELAGAIGISETTLSGMINRDVDRVSLDLFFKICDYLNCDPKIFYKQYSRNMDEYQQATELSKEERHLIDLFRQLTPKEQGNIIGRAELLVEQHENSFVEDAG